MELFVAIKDQSSPHPVTSHVMRSNMQRLTVSGKGQVGHHGRRLWKGGYGSVVNSMEVSGGHRRKVER